MRDLKQAELYRRMAELLERGEPFVEVTVVESRGSTPRGAGARMLVLGDGSTVGTIGGGKIERQAGEDAVELLRRGTSKLAHYALRQEGEDALGMVCGGDATVFLETHRPLSTLLVIGAGHIGQVLAPMARLLDYRVVVLDERPEFATAERFPDADQVIVGHPAEARSLVAIDEQTAVVIITHGHVHDQAALAAVLETPAWYIGMIGSRTKVRTVFAELRAAGVPAAALERVHAPIGLDLGGQTPGEISLSILGQIVARGPRAHGGSPQRSPGGLGGCPLGRMR